MYIIHNSTDESTSRLHHLVVQHGQAEARRRRWLTARAGRGTAAQLAALVQFVNRRESTVDSGAPKRNWTELRRGHWTEFNQHPESNCDLLHEYGVGLPPTLPVQFSQRNGRTLIDSEFRARHSDGV